MLLWVLAAAPASGQKSDATSAALVEKAQAATDLSAPGIPAYRMEGRVALYNARGDHENGSFLRIWNPGNYWHYEVVFPDFRSVSVSDGRSIWTSSNYPYQPFPIFQIGEALSFPRVLADAKQLELGAPRVMGDNGEKCVEATQTDPQKTEHFCFDPLSGNLVRMILDRWNLTYEFGDYGPMGARRFPRLLRVAESSGRPLAEIRIERLASEDGIDLRAFLPPAGSRKQPAEAMCGGVTDAKVVKMVKPDYPREALSTGLTGLVRFYIDIGDDGVPRGLWPLNATSPILSRAAAAAVKQWRYSPPICRANGAAMPLATDVTVIFTGP